MLSDACFIIFIYRIISNNLMTISESKMSQDGQTHRAGLFKLLNKKHSTGRHRSKRTIMRENKGKLGLKIQMLPRTRELKRQERRHKFDVIRENKSAKLLEKRQQEGGAPITTAIISFDENVTSLNIAEKICSADSDALISRNERLNIIHLSVPRYKCRYSFLFQNQDDDMFDILDRLKIADVLLLFWPINTENLNEAQLNLINAALAQGAPSTLNVISGIPLCGKQRGSIKKTLEKLMNIWTKDTSRILNFDNNNDSMQLLRHISTMKKMHSNLQKMRPYIVAESTEVVQNQDRSYSLLLSGYLRGMPLCVNNLLHISGYGDFQLNQIDRKSDPYPLRGNKNIQNMETNQNLLQIYHPDPMKQIPIDSEIIPDSMDQEQPDSLDEDKFATPTIKKRVPKGTSDYQASWLIEDDDDAASDYKNDSDSDKEMEEIENGPNVKSSFDAHEEEEDDRGSENDEEMQTDKMSTSVCDANDIDETLDDSQLQRFKQARENRQWPDEVETPKGMNARERFQRYRGLKSFKTSPWDPKENLPIEYARIYKIVDFKRTRKLALTELSNPFGEIYSNEYVFPGAFVTLHIKNIPEHLHRNMHTKKNIFAYGLLRHEHRMSILNMVLQKHPSCNTPIKNKDPLIFRVGCRQFIANPIFSQHTNGDKFKMERFMPNSGAFCATILAPITFSPTNVVVFSQVNSKPMQLLAHGMVLNANPDRIVLKRAVLSGHPFKVNKRSAVVRYMFFNREDCEWFKPVELYTHGGRHGRIKQALGTHGVMKCTFDQPLNVQDSVMMNLYKRVYPKWTYKDIATIALNSSFDKLENLKEKSEENSMVKKTVHFAAEPMDQ